MAREETSRLMIVAEAGPSSAVSGLTAVLQAADVAALVIVPAAQEDLSPATAKPLVELAQANDVAALIQSDARRARTLKADGVHVPWGKDVIERYSEAREIVGNRFIVGIDAGRSRHDAMSLGEAGADYVGFGIPSHVEDRETAIARRLDLIGWWSEIFEVPCVAFDVTTPQEAGALSSAGADFIALRIPAGRSPADLSTWVTDFDESVLTQENVS